MAYDTNNKKLSKIETLNNNEVYEDYNDIDNDLDFNLLNDILLYKQLHDMFSKINKHPYIIYLFGLIIGFMDNLLTYLLLYKIHLQKMYEKTKDYILKKNFITEVYLINNNNYIKCNKFQHNKVNKEIFINTFNDHRIDIDNCSCILIKYCYENNNYRIYLNYDNMNNEDIYLPLIIKEEKEKIIERFNKNQTHFLNNECNEIEYAKINDLDIKDLIIECNGPFYDFGLINNNKIYIKYLMNELKINNLVNFEIKYRNFHFDEDNMELVDHIYETIESKDYIKSRIMDQILLK